MENLIISQTIQTLLQGGLILYPTDTIWGLGCDARNQTAVEHLFSLKKRELSKSMLILCTDDMIDADIWCPPVCDYPTTYILPHAIWKKALKTTIADNLIAKDGTLGIRVTNHGFCKEILDVLRAPIVSTSANFSGRSTPLSPSDIDPILKQHINYCVPPLPEWESGKNRSSRIVKVTQDGEFLILRE